MINKHIQDAIDMENKSTHSDKIFNTGAVLCSAVTLALIIACVVVYLVDNNGGLILWQCLFYPMLVFSVPAIYLSFAQVLRNRYFSVIISSVLSVLNILIITTIIILQAVILKQVYIVPFIFF